MSSKDQKEALEAIAGGADIIDVKNPEEGALGASFPWVINRIKKKAPANIEVSCAIGDVPNLPCAVSLTALGAATTGVDYIKVGLFGVKTKDEAIYLMQKVTKAVKEYNSRIKVVVTGYADAEKIGSVDPLFAPEIAYVAKADVAMIDTAVKDGANLFTFLTINQLRSFVSISHAYGLKAALAGSLSKKDLSRIYASGADIVGFRGAVCSNGDRATGQIIREKVMALVEAAKFLAKDTRGDF